MTERDERSPSRPFWLSLSRPIDRWRTIIETPPGARPLEPAFGCRVHELASFEDAVSRRLAEELIAESLARWCPDERILSVRVDVARSASAANDDEAPTRRLDVIVRGNRHAGRVEVEIDPPGRTRAPCARAASTEEAGSTGSASESEIDS